MKTRTQRREPTPLTDRSVCVIDGDSGIRNSLYMLLATLGIQAATFPSAEEFLVQINEKEPAFLIVELSLPGMDGFELKQVLNDQGRRIPCIGLTGEKDQSKSNKAKRLGFLDLVEKPFVYWKVVDQIQETLPPFH